MNDVFRDALILAGPTGSGKSALALDLAERLGAEIVAMDSMTLYRGMDIGTAKPSRADRARVPHHLVDVLDPWESGNVAWWLDQAVHYVRDIQARNKRALFVGGTPLYLKAVFEGIFTGPSHDAEVRRRLEQEAATLGAAELHRRLATVDPTTAARLHPNDVRRVVRALEVWETTKQPISAWQCQWAATDGSSPGPRCIWIDRPRDELYARINARVLAMIAAGWVDEARRLLALPRPLSREAGQALGYAQLFAHLEGKANLDETIALIQTRSRQFAKRQLTWFRNMAGCEPLAGTGSTPAVQDLLWRFQQVSGGGGQKIAVTSPPFVL